MRASQTLIPLSIAALVIVATTISPVSAGQVFTTMGSGGLAATAVWSGNTASVVSPVIGGGAVDTYCPPGPYCGRYSDNSPWRGNNRWERGEGFKDWYKKGNQTCVFNGYDYRCYGSSAM